MKTTFFNPIIESQINKYLDNGKDFINEEEIFYYLEKENGDDYQKLKHILQKSLEIKTLAPDETAFLLNVKNPEYWEEIFHTATLVKKKVYDNRIVTFAPLYCSNYCVNNCKYCGFRIDNKKEIRKKLSIDEVKKETAALINAGHKRLILVYGEHPESNIDYIVDTINAVYSVKIPASQHNKKVNKHLGINTKSNNLNNYSRISETFQPKKVESGKDNEIKGYNTIRRVNINSAPLSIEDLVKMKEAGIGTYQVFQETYHKNTYKKMHPSGIKANYRWRLYALHRAMDAGIDDVAVGALFGIYDWKFDVMGLLYHALDLEKKFNIGPHTVSFPRLMPAAGSEISKHSKYKVSDDDFKKLIAVLRLSIPYSGMIITAREPEYIRNEVIPLGITQTDASTKIGIGSYSKHENKQNEKLQQFLLGDTRSLEEVITFFAKQGIITSFCTAGYRCGRTGDKIMRLLRTGTEGKFCKLNAVLTFKEWLYDYASEETKKLCQPVIEKEINEIKNDPFFKNENLLNTFFEYLKKIDEGYRDIYI